jgi:hypothetical protein
MDEPHAMRRRYQRNQSPGPFEEVPPTSHLLRVYSLTWLAASWTSAQFECHTKYTLSARACKDSGVLG